MDKNLTQQLKDAVDNKEAEYIGVGPWIKDSAYQVNQWNGKYYAWIVYDKSNLYVLENSAIEIDESEIDIYI